MTRPIYLTTGRLEAIVYALSQTIASASEHEISHEELETARAWAEQALATRREGKRASPRGLIDRPKLPGQPAYQIYPQFKQALLDHGTISPDGGTITLDIGPGKP